MFVGQGHQLNGIWLLQVVVNSAMAELTGDSGSSVHSCGTQVVGYLMDIGNSALGRSSCGEAWSAMDTPGGQ